MRYRFLRYPGGKVKAVTLSYDDGTVQDLRFVERIDKAGLKCTFNLNSERFCSDLTDEQIKKHILDKGHEIAVHGALHRAQGTVRPIEGIKDVLDCRLELENRFGIIVRGMAYPDTGVGYFTNGATYENTKQYLTDLDIVYSRILGKDNFDFELPTDWHNWTPTVYQRNKQVMDYIDRFIELEITDKTYHARREPRLFYMWGHTAEFDRYDSWQLLDEMCDKLAGHDDIWYATNIEIYDYVNAYNSLVFSADGTIVYNPTLFDIWFDIDYTVYKISPGETLKIQKKY